MGNLVSSDRFGTRRLFYERPAETWLEALPVGNGRIGAMWRSPQTATRNASSATATNGSQSGSRPAQPSFSV